MPKVAMTFQKLCVGEQVSAFELIINFSISTIISEVNYKIYDLTGEQKKK